MTFKQMFTSSVGKKLVMAFTGIFLILFLVVHAGLNACIWAMDGGLMFNKAGQFCSATHFRNWIILGYLFTYHSRVYVNLRKQK
jgi:succinate dehydrogenase / fumarate reductase cytochrome b subunit